MANFSVNGVYQYQSANIYSYLGRIPSNETKLEKAFKEFKVKPHGDVNDLKKLKTAMYAEYSEQVQNQIANQEGTKVAPWAGLMAQIGVQATGDHTKDYAAFNEAIQLLSQGAIDGQAMTYFAGLKSEAQKVFGLQAQPGQGHAPMTFEEYQARFL